MTRSADGSVDGLTPGQGRELAVVRHGQAVSHAPTDLDRPLTDHGRVQAQAAGRLLADRWGSIDLAVHSVAVRTTQTWREMALAAGKAAPSADGVWPARRAYEAGVPDLLAVLADVPPEARRVVLVGHAPGMPSLLGFLTGDRPDRWPTGQVGLIGLPDDVAWDALHEGCGARRG